MIKLHLSLQLSVLDSFKYTKVFLIFFLTNIDKKFLLTCFYLLMDVICVRDHDILHIRTYHVVTAKT